MTITLTNIEICVLWGKKSLTTLLTEMFNFTVFLGKKHQKNKTKKQKKREERNKIMFWDVTPFKYCRFICAGRVQEIKD